MPEFPTSEQQQAKSEPRMLRGGDIPVPEMGELEKTRVGEEGGL